jgi:hypothetical protein
MARIPETEISARSREKARRFTFCVEAIGESKTEFKIRGKEYIGKITDRRGVISVECSCIATASCYHLPHYVEEYRRRQMLDTITAGTVIKYAVASPNENLPDRIYTGLVVRVVKHPGGRREYKLQGVTRAISPARVIRVVRKQLAQAA